MRNLSEEKTSSATSIRTSIRSMALLVLSIACFIVFLWLLTVIVRVLAGFGAA